MRTTLALDDELVLEAQRLTGTSEKSALVRQADGSINFSAWVEVGMTVGYDCQTKKTLGQRMFWADNRTGGGYHEYSLSTTKFLPYGGTLEVKSAPNSTWNVRINGVLAGTSASNGAVSYGAHAGEELLYNAGSAAAKFSNLQYIASDGTYHSDWPTKTVYDKDPPAVYSPNTDGSFWTYSNWTCGEIRGVSKATNQTGASTTVVSIDDALKSAKGLAGANAVPQPTSTVQVDPTTGDIMA